jgi:hypothetical protein
MKIKKLKVEDKRVNSHYYDIFNNNGNYRGSIFYEDKQYRIVIYGETYIYKCDKIKQVKEFLDSKYKSYLNCRDIETSI